MTTEMTPVARRDRNGAIAWANWLAGSLVFLLLAGCGAEGPRQPSVASSRATAPEINLSVCADEPHQALTSHQPEMGTDTEASASSARFFTDWLVNSSEQEKLKAAQALMPKDAPTIAMTSTSRGATASVTWQVVADSSNAETQVIGYYVHYGKQPADQMGGCFYEERITANAPPVTIHDLEPNMPYFFAISAYNEYDSPCSREASAITPPAQ